jgi:hypothetical protein
LASSMDFTLSSPGYSEQVRERSEKS